MAFSSINFPLVPPLPLPQFVHLGEPTPDLWPLPGTPQPNLHARGLTEARCVIQFWHGRTTDERLDGLKHLPSICMLKAGEGAYWSPKPYLKFVGARTSQRDWENSDP